ncbi:MAG: thiamine pyrophosphate-dependent dehydrogenase E1 component subunit alpha, partial [Candidatus Atribacteria bacterium]|nr:thiamine pyrophosphate-dependent dehydrogenase E1 component subunit alpha [Candidatus Atribacteria bacterium]
HNYDNDLGYRTQEEFNSWKERDPVSIFETFLIKESLITKNEINEIESNIQNKVDLAFEYAAKSDFPKEEEAYKDIYAK